MTQKGLNYPYMATTIRLTMTKELEQGLKKLQAVLPFMKRDEILKLSLSRLYDQEVNGRYVGDIPMVTEEEEEQIGRALEQFKKGEYIDVDMSNKKQVKALFGV